MEQEIRGKLIAFRKLIFYDKCIRGLNEHTVAIKYG